jgi:hypothetical protein
VNCEFGLVQRYFGAEPLGMLRWNAIHPDKLAVGLEQRFEDIGQLENLKLETLNGEYIVSDYRYRTVMHTFLYEKDAPLTHDQLLTQFGRRMRFLRAKLMEDLTEGEKIFVYQYPRMLSEQEMLRIQAAIQSYGPGTVLFVTDTGKDRPVGHVEEAQSRRLVGYVDRLVRDEGWSSISVDAWLAVCENAIHLGCMR